MTILTTLSKFAMYLLSALLVLAIGVDWFFYLTVRRTYDLVAEDSRSIHRIISDRGPYLPPSGLNVKGERFSTDESVEFWAVRFASKDCHFCENDQPIWARLDASLRQNGYKVFTLVPAPTEEYPANASAITGTTQISYIDPEWIQEMDLTRTPTVILFKKRHGVIWTHQGVLSLEDLASAKRVMDEK